MLFLGDRFVGLAKTKTFKMSTVETVNSGLTHFPMGRGNYLRRAGLPFVRLILSAVLLGGALSQVAAEATDFEIDMTTPGKVNVLKM